MRVFEALGDVNRRRLLEYLASGEMTAGELVEALQREAAISQPAVSQHLRVLLEVGLVSARRDGRSRHYSLSRIGLERARQWLTGLIDPLAPFSQPLDALDTEIARGRKRTQDGSEDEALPA